MSEIKRYAIVENGTVVNVILWDGVPFTAATDDEPAAGWSPPDGSQAILLDADATVSPGWTYDGAHFLGPAIPAPSEGDILNSNTATRDALLAQATLAIAPLQDAVDLDEATDSEITLLKQWKQYRVTVNRVDLTQSSPTWPTSPSAS